MSNIEQAFKNEDVEPFIIFLIVRSLKDHLPRVDYESNIHDAHESDDEKRRCTPPTFSTNSFAFSITTTKNVCTYIIRG